VTGEWKKLLHNLHLSPGHVARMGQGRKVYKVLVGNPEGKRPLGSQGVGGGWNRNGSYRDWRGV
jgi:hypothetical protein